MSRFWLRLTLLWVLLGVARAHHFFRLVILAALGLAGLWMVHTLAQDFNAIQSQQQFHSVYKRAAGGLDVNYVIEPKGLGSPKPDATLGSISRTVPSPFGTRTKNPKVKTTVGPRSVSTPRPKKGIDWERVLSRDPFGCARSFLCQLAATEERDADEELMLRLVSLASPNEGRAVVELQGSVRRGEELRSAPACMRVYKYCPYSSRVMMRLMKFFGRSP